MSNCPNRKHPDWITTVNNVGLINAYRLFVNNGYNIPTNGAFKTVEDVEKHLSSSNKLNKRNGLYYIKYISPSTFKTNLDVIAREVERINTMYEGPLLVIDTHPVEDSKTGRRVAHFVDINEQALAEFWSGFKADQKEAGVTINEEGDVMPFDESMYQQREGWADDRETLKDFRQKVKYLKTVFPGYDIVEDRQLSIPGQIDKDGKTVRLNPDLITRDSIGHEFGHIIIDSIGGLSNPLVQKAREQLIGSPIELQVMEKYPDLIEKDPEKLDKEIIAQAIGKESIGVFETEFQLSEWRRWLQRFYNKVKQSLGIGPTAVIELSNKLVSRNWTKKDKAAEEKMDKEYEEAKKAADKSSIDKLRQDALDILYTKHKIRTRHGRDSNTSAIERLIDQIKKDDRDGVKSLALFRDFAFKETEAIYLEYQEATEKEANGLQGFSLRKLNKWNNYIAGFDAIGEYITMIEEAAFDKENPELAKKIQKVLVEDKDDDAKQSGLDKLRTTRERYAVIKKAYKDQGINLIAKFLTKYSNHISARFKTEFERDYNKLAKAERQKISKEDYIKQKLELKADTINKLTELNIKRELARANEDVGYVTRWVENLLDSPDPVVSSMVNAMTQTMRKTRLQQVALKDELVEILQELEEFRKGQSGFFQSHRQFYDFMLEKDKDGKLTGNIIDVFSSQFWIDYATERAKWERKHYSYTTVQDKLRDWRNKNAPMTPERKKQFKKDRIALVEAMHTNGELSSQELVDVKASFKSRFHVDLHDKINMDAATKITTWVRDKSWEYREPIEQYKSKSWENLVRMAGGDPDVLTVEDQVKVVRENTTDPRLKFYNFIKNKLEETEDGLPHIHRLRDRLPGLQKKGREIIREGNVAQGLKQMVIEEHTVLRDETERGDVSREITKESGEPMHFLPVHYTKRLDIENQSFDLADGYLRYFFSAMDYANKNEVLPEMEMARFLVNNREVIRTNSAGGTISDALRGRALTKAGTTSMIAAQLNDWFDSIIYGEKEKDQGTFGKTRMDRAKFANALGRYTGLNLLAANFVQGTANVLLGSTMQWIEAFGAEHYKPKDYLKAKLFYNKHLGGVVGDIGSRRPKGIISLLNREFDTLNEYEGGNIRRNSKFAQMMSTNTLFFTSHAGEHWMQTKVMLAMLNNLKAKDENGKVIGNMLDKISAKDGKLVVDPEVKNFGDEERRIFEGKMKRVLSALHGEYSEMGRVALQRGALGRLAYMFRKFVMPGYRRRWQKKRINNITGQEVEGNYRTFGRFISMWAKDLRRLQFSLMAEDWRSLTTTEKANVRRTLGEAVFLLATFLLINFVVEGDDDQPKEEGLYAFLAYQIYRFRAELSFFVNPMETLKILRSPMASMSVIENSIKLIGQLLDPVWDGDLKFDRYTRGNWKGTPKINKTLINFIPAYKQIYRLRYVDDQISWLKN